MDTNRRSGAWAGWVAFAACMLMVVGVLNLFQGIAALADEAYFRTPSGNLLVWDFDTWGVILVCFGGLQLLVALGLFSGSGVARWTAAGLTMLNIVGQIGFLDARPVWTSIVIALDVVVLYALTARWGAAMGTSEVADTHTTEAEWQADMPPTRAHRSGMPPQEPGSAPGDDRY